MRTAAANLASIMIRPRATMRRILDAGRDRMIIPLVTLAAISGFLGDFDRQALEALRARGLPVALLVAGIIAGSILITLLFFYLFSWAAFGIGKVMEGSGTAREVRSAAAWGLAPIVWALAYRLPVVLFWPESLPSKVQIGSDRFQVNASRLGSSCFAMAVIGTLELVVLIWTMSVASNTIGEAHRFSSWRGLAAIVLTLISPALIALAAFLAA